MSRKMRKKVKNLKNMTVENEGVKCNRILIDENFVLHFATDYPYAESIELLTHIKD